jgi:hypothetical protein
MANGAAAGAGRKRAGAREIALAALFFLLATVVFTWPIAARVSDGLADVWDAKLCAWIFHWDFHQTFHDPLRLFDANIFYPGRYALAFSENLYGAALFGFPLYAAGVSTLTGYNVLFLLGMFLSALAAWALARDVTGDPAASLLSGIVYAFVPWRLAQIPHVQYQWGPFLALSLLFLLRFLDRGRRHDGALFGLFFVWNALANIHYAFFCAILVAVVLVYELLASSDPAVRRRFPASLLVLALAFVALLPFLIPYRKASRLYRMERSEGEITVFSGRPVDFLTAGSQNKLYAPLTQKLGQAEGDFFPGLSVVALAAWGLWRRRGPRPVERYRASDLRRSLSRYFDAAIAATLFLWMVSGLFGRDHFGPIKLRDPGRLVFLAAVLLVVRLILAFPAWSRFASLGDFVRRMRIGARAGLFVAVSAAGILVALGTHTPFYRFGVQTFGSVFRAIRVPSRGIVLFDLAIGVLAAWGLSRLARGRRWIVAGALAVVAFEYRAFPVDVQPVEREPGPVYRWLAGVRLPGSVIEWPFATDAEVEYEFRSTAHWKPLVNGYSGFAPPRYQELAAMFAEKPIRAEIWNKISDAGACLLIVHPRAIPDEARGSYAGLLRAGIEERRLEPLTTFADRDGSDLVFRFAACPSFDPRITASAWPAAAKRALEGASELEHALHPPFGIIDRPRENDTVSPGTWGFGWALDDSGIAQVRVSFDDGPVVPTAIHQPHPGVTEAHPGYPETAAPGFGFPVPPLPAGPHTLKVTLVARDGGKTEIQRRIVVR